MVILCLLNLIVKTNWVFYIPWALFVLLFLFIVFNRSIAPWLIGNLKTNKQTKNKTKQTLALHHQQNGESRGVVRWESVVDEVGIMMTV